MNGRQEIFEKMRAISYYDTLSESELYDIINTGVVKKIRADSFIYYQGDESDFVYYLITGTLEFIKVRKNYSSLLLNTVNEDEWFGISEAFYTSEYLNDARAKDETFVILYNKNVFRKLCMKYPEFQRIITERIAKEIYNIHFNLDSLSPQDKILKLLRARLEAFRKEGEVEINITQEEIAELIGFTRETVNKTLHKLQDEGLIKLKRGGIICSNENLNNNN
ncbi:MAG: hypothetical protein A2015_09560 [Spirochaetes bacterium GWF1_31_7]|nr:MAG: hypothetical protein A2Y30_01250 [Spirochaetes bacterium GWE1_32_154]OHD45099.1 MAG: hypothetical protein A2Y29_15295 [Spirochaetes bacterium GWE2_31_10]OHD52666.1 MAG: hypothetical protein A2015_09560 [Spirochaetes bacterium GWF1_31_7]OHD75874.1 MAG: hypothetical protein A2355_04165 [Spirochaetes bacterium RIFOXYB1_FULL_32_8]HBD95226.1 hypothetical protein [Spirochaetia bacterium]